MGNHQISTELGTITFHIDAIRSLVKGTVSDYFIANNKDTNKNYGISLLESNATQISELKQGGIDIDIYVGMNYGTPMPKVISPLRDTIHHNLMAFADLDVNVINIHVERISVPEKSIN